MVDLLIYIHVGTHSVCPVYIALYPVCKGYQTSSLLELCLFSGLTICPK